LKQGGLSVEQKQSILTQILSGIEFLHNNGIIHRDLKPQNILIVKRGNEYIPKITDFGISKQLDVNKSSVFSNSIAGAGTLAYASPEQLGDRTIRKNADLWSFGVIAYQTLSGSLPFTTGAHVVTSEEGRMELFQQIKSGVLPAIINSIAEPWQKLIRACLVSDPDKRIKNTQEAKNILTGNNDEVHIPANDKTQIDVPPVQSDHAESKQKNKRLTRLIIGCVALFYTLLAVVFLLQIESEKWRNLSNFASRVEYYDDIAMTFLYVSMFGLALTVCFVSVLLFLKKISLQFGASIIFLCIYAAILPLFIGRYLGILYLCIMFFAIIFGRRKKLKWKRK
jgi:serine/threonine protein kinase